MKYTKNITFVSLLSALSIIFARFLSLRISIGGVEGIRIGFGDLPLMLTGILLGPWWGALAGIVADIIGYILSPMGPYMPHFTFTSALKGFLPGILFIYLLKESKNLISLSILFLISKITVSSLIVFFIHVLFGLPYSVLIPPRIIAILIEIPLYTIITLPLLIRLEKEILIKLTQ